MRIAIIVYQTQSPLLRYADERKCNVDQLAIVSPAIQIEQRKYAIGSFAASAFSNRIAYL